MSTVLLTQSIADTLHEIVDEYGRDHIYASSDEWSTACYYRQPVREVIAGEGSPVLTHSEGEPGCLIGHLLDRLGVLPPVLAYNEEYATEHNLGARLEGFGVRHLLSLLPVEIEDQEMVSVLSEVQRVQDDGLPWGRALDLFYRRTEGWA